MRSIPPYQMVDLVFKAPRATRERLMLQLPNTEAEPEMIDECFQVSIDLPGHGKRRDSFSLHTYLVSTQGWMAHAGDTAVMRPLPSELASHPKESVAWLSDIIRSLGKTSCLALVGMEHSCTLILKVRLSHPNARAP